MFMKRFLQVVLFAALTLLGSSGFCSASAEPHWDALIERLSEDGVDPDRLATLFAHPNVKPDVMLMVRKLSHRESKLNYGRFLKKKPLALAAVYFDENRELLEAIEVKHDVPGEVIVAILLVETYLGNYLGNAHVFNTLANMAAVRDFEVIRPHLPERLLTPEKVERTRKRFSDKAEWAYGELKALITFTEANGIDPMTVKGSIFGAMGICQFLPSNAHRLGVDWDGDGKIDLFEEQDALASIANYLKAHGWKPGMTDKEKGAVIYRYNHSKPYVKTILAIAAELDGKKPGSSKK